MNFMSDNVSGAAPAILQALLDANADPAPSYGHDRLTARLQDSLRTLFDHPAMVSLPVATGTAANAIALACLCPPWGTIYCHEQSHVHVDECGAPEMHTGGAKLVPLPGADGKLSCDVLSDALARARKGFVHHQQPAVLSLTQATEAGRSYTPDETAALCAIAKRHGLKVHMDGARFANAIAHWGCAPEDATWRAGVDALCFGATKNGALGAEAILFFNPADAEQAGYRRKRSGHLFSKMRFLSAQLDAYARDDLWLRLARRANAAAHRLADGLAGLPGARLVYPVEANEVFIDLPLKIIEGLEAADAAFYRWDGTVVRLVTSWNAEDAVMDRFINLANHLARHDQRST
jgi:threonine aldolase